MGVNREIYQVFKQNIMSFGLENAANILNVDFTFLKTLLKHESINYNNLRLRYTIQLNEYSTNRRKKNTIIFR